MPPRVPLPRLTLFTGGKECSLCEVAKQELATLRKSTAFDLVYWNIRDPPAEADEWEAKKWRRLYQYEIVAGIAFGGQEGPETSNKSPRAAEGARGMESPSTDVERDAEPAIKTFKPYSSILKFTSAPARLQHSSSATDKKASPPWRRAVGRAHFSSDFLEDQGREEDGGYSVILERTFAGFSDEIIGSDVPVVDFRALDVEADWGIDELPGPQVAGEKGVLYDVADEVAHTTPIKNNRACWNCGSAHHELVDCPHKRDQGQIALSRATFEAQKGSMPDYAIPFLKMYTLDTDEKARRLALVDRFRPGEVSQALLDAVFFTDEEMTSDEIQQMEGWRNRRYYPWYQWMLKWGYPPGWIAGRDPIKCLHDQLDRLPTEEDHGTFDDGDDVLQVFGGNVDDGISREAPVPSSPTSSDMSLDSATESSVGSEKTPMPRHAPLPTDSPPPPPPLAGTALPRPPSPPHSPPPPPPPDGLPPPPPSVREAPIRWARYDTDLFDSDRLMAFTTARPLPLGF